jgi:hypothetical protein
VHRRNEPPQVASGKPTRYVESMSRFLVTRAGRRGITVLALALLIIAVVILVVVLSRYIAV